MPSETKHTQGPLVALKGKQADGYYHVRRDHGGKMTTGYFFVQGDADLFAAAPEMLEALDDLIAIAESNIHDELEGTSYLDMTLSDFEPARAALRKARGE